MATAKELAEQLKQLVDANYAIIAKLRAVGWILGNDHASWKSYRDSLFGVKNAKSEADARAALMTDHFADKSTIDPMTRMDIFDRIVWPNISVFSPGWMDDPKGKIEKSTMKGVTYDSIWNNNGFTDAVFYAFNIDTYIPGWLSSGTTVSQNFKTLNDAFDNLAKSPDIKGADKTNNRKEVMNILFGSDNVVKLFFLQNYLIEKDFANPWAMMGIDPYFGYLLMFTGWTGGKEAFTERKAKITLENQEGTYSLADIVRKVGKQSNFSNYSMSVYAEACADTDNAATPFRANFPRYATRFLEVTAGWLAAQKTSQPDLYADWNNKFIVDKKCMINMLVIVNELVNLSGTANTFTYGSKVVQFQNAVGLAYKNFEITVGD